MEGTGLQKTKKQKLSWKMGFDPQRGWELGARERTCIRGEGVRRMDRSREGGERPSRDV